MVRRKIVAISVAVAILLVASFVVGALNSPFEGIVSRNLESPPVGSSTDLAALTPSKGIEPQPSQPTLRERMVIYNARISLETTDMQSVLNRISALAESYGGYVAGSSRTSDGAEITIRVPKDNFHAAVQQIETYGKVVNEQRSSEDVTEQFIDLKARLENLQRQEQRLRDILSLAKTVDEVLQVERELERVRGDVESLQGQMNYLARSVAMSLISVGLTAPPPPFTPPGMDWKETFQTALMGLFMVLRGLIILVVSVLPLAAISLPAYYVYRKRKVKRAPSKT